MRLLADENFPKPIVEALRSEGHDVLWARTDRAGAKDPVLLDLAESEARVVLTLDKDFWQIAVQRRNPLDQSGVVLFRVHPATPEKLGPLVHAFVAASAAWAAGNQELITGAGRWLMAHGQQWFWEGLGLATNLLPDPLAHRRRHPVRPPPAPAGSIDLAGSSSPRGNFLGPTHTDAKPLRYFF